MNRCVVTTLTLALPLLAVACLPAADPIDVFPVLQAGDSIELPDVALVWPLPRTTGADADDGYLGPILGCDTISTFEALTRTDEPEVLCQALMVTAARLDPCFRQGGPTVECEPELRLILQPVVDGDARDASIHAFYSVPDLDLDRAIARLAALRIAAGEDGRGPLRVHPLLSSKDGRLAVADVVGDLLAVADLKQFTQITVHGDDAAWTFEFREFTDGAPTAGDARQQHVLSPSSATIGVSVTPESGSDDAFPLLLRDDDAAAATVADLQAAYDRAARVEHPDVHNPGTIDCATCHLAQPARVAALRRTPTLSLSPEAFTSDRYDLTPTAVFDNPQFIHAFAWRHADLAINQRLLNEAARSADLATERLTARGVLP